MSAGKAARDFGGVVAGTVIHDDHFRLQLPFTDVGEYFGERSSQSLALVVSRDYEAVIHLQLRRLLIVFQLSESKCLLGGGDARRAAKQAAVKVAQFPWRVLPGGSSAFMRGRSASALRRKFDFNHAR